jgi:hypothetical protein
LVATLADVDAAPLQTWVLPLSFAGAVGESVDRAMYWQPPDDQDVVAADPAIREALRPIAAAIAASPAAHWWDDDAALSLQRYTSMRGEDQPADRREPLDAQGKLDRWRQKTVDDDLRAHRELPADPAAPYGGPWWSSPNGAGLPRTTRALKHVGSVRLLWEEDGLGQEDAFIWQVRPRAEARVYEVHDADAWVDLVRRYPLDVTYGRRHVWYQTTGRAGTWLIPDWRAVSRDWDGVHVSVLGYLTTATRALQVEQDAATMLAGWDPDETFWLTDTLQLVDDRPEHWTMTSGQGTGDVLWEAQPTRQ